MLQAHVSTPLVYRRTVMMAPHHRCCTLLVLLVLSFTLAGGRADGPDTAVSQSSHSRALPGPYVTVDIPAHDVDAPLSFAVTQPNGAGGLPLSASLLDDSLLVSTLLGQCRGFTLPGSVRWCLHPGDALDVQVTLDSRGWPEWAAALLPSLSMEVKADPPSLIFAPSTLLPVRSGIERGSPTSVTMRGLLRATASQLGIFAVSLALQPAEFVRLREDHLNFSLEVVHGRLTHVPQPSSC